MEGNVHTGRGALERKLAEALRSIACSHGGSPQGRGAIAAAFCEALDGQPAAWFVRTAEGWLGACHPMPKAGAVEAALANRFAEDADDIGCEATAFRRSESQRQWPRALLGLGFDSGLIVPACVGGQLLGLLVLGSPEAVELVQTSGPLLAVIGSGLGMRTALDRGALSGAEQQASSAPPPGSVMKATGAAGFVSSEEAMRRITWMGQLASLGTLAGGLVHEINNPATFIALAAGQLEKAITRILELGDCSAAEGALEFTSGIQDSTRQIRDMVAAFRLLVGVANQSVVVTVDLERVLEAAVELTRAAHRHDAVLKRDIEPMPPCPGRYLDLGPVVVNVLVNAIESFRDSTIPKTVHVQARVRDDVVGIRVTDNGRGIAPGILPRVFDPFFTSKDPARHAGLGLTIARATLAGLGGSIKIESEAGKGTSVNILIPLRLGHDQMGSHEAQTSPSQWNPPDRGRR